MSHIEEVVIVGSGPSGLVCASALLAAGFSVQDARLHLAAYAAFHNVTSSVRSNCRLMSLERLEPARGDAYAEPSAAGGKWRLVFEDSSPGQGGSAQQQGPGARYALTADFVILATGQPQPSQNPAELLPPAQAALIPPGCRLMHASAATAAEVEAAGGAWVVGDGEAAVDAASAAALLRKGRGVRLLKTGPAGVCEVDGPSLLDSARRRALGAAMQPHPSLPVPSNVDRALRAPTKRRFWAHLGSKPEPPLALVHPTSASTGATGADGGGAPGLVVWAPSLEDPRVLPFLGPSLRAALLRPPGVEGSAGGSGAHACLYRGMLHPDVPGLAFVGLEAHAGTSLLLHQLQARWLVSYLTAALPAPSLEAMRADLARQRAWRAAALTVPYMSRGGSLAAAGERGYAAQLLVDLEGLVALRREGGRRAAGSADLSRSADVKAGATEALVELPVAPDVSLTNTGVELRGSPSSGVSRFKRLSERVIGGGGSGTGSGGDFSPQRRASAAFDGPTASPLRGQSSSSRLVLSVASPPLAPYLQEKLRRAVTTTQLPAGPTSAASTPSASVRGGSAFPNPRGIKATDSFKRNASLDLCPRQHSTASVLGRLGGSSKRRFGTGHGSGNGGGNSRGNSNSGCKSPAGRRESDLSAQLHHLSSRTGVDMAVLADLLTDDGAGGGGLGGGGRGGGGGALAQQHSGTGKAAGSTCLLREGSSSRASRPSNGSGVRPSALPRPTLAAPTAAPGQALDPVLSVGSDMEYSCEQAAAAAMAAAAAAASVVSVTEAAAAHAGADALDGHARDSGSAANVLSEGLASPFVALGLCAVAAGCGQLFGASSGKRYSFTAGGGLVGEPSNGSSSGPSERGAAARRGSALAVVEERGTSACLDAASEAAAAASAAAATAAAGCAPSPVPFPAPPRPRSTRVPGPDMLRHSSTRGPSGCGEPHSEAELDSDDEGSRRDDSSTDRYYWRRLAASRRSQERIGDAPVGGPGGSEGAAGGRPAQSSFKGQLAALRHALLGSQGGDRDSARRHGSPAVEARPHSQGPAPSAPTIVALACAAVIAEPDAAEQGQGRLAETATGSAGRSPVHTAVVSAAAVSPAGSPRRTPSRAALALASASAYPAYNASAASDWQAGSPGRWRSPRVSAGGSPAVDSPRRRHTSSCLYPRMGGAAPGLAAGGVAAADALSVAMALTATSSSARRIGGSRRVAPDMQD
ncbi:hypothetical protein HYH03_016587 [Edaphochlamys debaryana]|uniref:FAD/NAD(P)-binding domain-containing protein n=1 Tax=Edaphochlamys debaryana TaxID=47281 RepID=A0A836BRG6_9CHLO|nr:hypothetical protein HYH03_016587 [Edaphochlamys debaryana]|eukprot:KAG2484633.1 hypothetical protein HYH03_016587 [Edaphochlamys debaryana]